MSSVLPPLEPGLYRIEYQSDHHYAGRVVTVLEVLRYGGSMYMLKMLDCEGEVTILWTYPHELKRLDL